MRGSPLRAASRFPVNQTAVGPFPGPGGLFSLYLIIAARSLYIGVGITGVFQLAAQSVGVLSAAEGSRLYPVERSRLPPRAASRFLENQRPAAPSPGAPALSNYSFRMG